MGLLGRKNKDPAVTMHLSALLVLRKSLDDDVEFAKASLTQTIMELQSRYMNDLDSLVAYDTRGHLVEVPKEVWKQIISESKVVKN